MTIAPETLEGSVEIVTFHNEENGFCVLKIRSKLHKNPISVVGNLPTVQVGAEFVAEGNWIHDRRFGQQFKASKIELKPPSTTLGLEKYLASGLIKGVGKVNAKKLVSHFKENIFDIIDQDPDRLLEIPGFSRALVDKILESWQDQRVIKDIMLFLHSHDISAARATRIYRLYGHQAMEVITQNPYRLAYDIRGFGFISADRLALKLGVQQESIIRARAGIHYVLTNAMSDGHCALPQEVLIEKSVKLLEISQDVLWEALDQELEEGTLIQHDLKDVPCIFLKSLFKTEKDIVYHIKRILKADMPYRVMDLHGAIEWVEQENNIALSTTQKKALGTVLTNKISIVTGGPGVGKTTLLKSILKILRTKDLKVNLCAPTGRAAKRMQDATGIEAKTIHRLLNINPVTGHFSADDHDPLKCDVLVIDEVSMVDVSLMCALLKAVPTKAVVIIVGDKDQLPSVGPGQVLTDFIQSGLIPFVHLTETFRQAASSNIIQIAQEINRSQMPQLKGFDSESDFFFMESSDPDMVLSTIVELVKKRLPQKYGCSFLEDIQVLSPMNKGIVGIKNLNVELQKALNPQTNTIEKFGVIYGVGDKVIQTENNYQKDVYNGDIGVIKAIYFDDEELSVHFDGRDVKYSFQELEELNLAYAMTIHKSQGSEYPVVIIPLLTVHYPMLKKNLVYTGMTRGKKLVILIGQRRALEIALQQNNEENRWSGLEQHLIAQGELS